jgi:S-adenosylmethionine:tRNA ribosyltransferase-isomerase
VLVSDFDYALPPELIAQQPLADRANSRMLHLVRQTGQVEDRQFREFPDLLRPNDLVVFNDTRVFPARLYGRRSGARSQPVSRRNPAARDFLRGKVEVLLTGPVAEVNGAERCTPSGLQSHEAGWSRPSGLHAEEPSKSALAAEVHLPESNPLVWNALVRPGRKIGVGEKLFFGDNDELRAEVIARGEFGERTLRFDPVDDFFAVVERIGHVPLPPYIARADEPADRERYQTVYARTRGSVAAPTAGLHFTPEILERIRARGIETAEITLHVGLGTFQPVHVEKVEEHHLHREWYRISEQVAAAINRALAAGRRIVAIGTTAVRTLEYAASLERPSFPEHPGSPEDSDFQEHSTNSPEPLISCPEHPTGEWAPAPSPGLPSASPASLPRRAPSPAAEQSHPVRVHPGSGEADIFIYPGFQFQVVGALLTNFHLPKSTLLMLVSAFAGREVVLSAYKYAVEQRYRFYSYGDCMFVE